MNTCTFLYIFVYITFFIALSSSAQQADTLTARSLDEVVVSASRIKENYLQISHKYRITGSYLKGVDAPSCLNDF